jgi:hypothetical protein
MLKQGKLGKYISNSERVKRISYFDDYLHGNSNN